MVQTKLPDWSGTHRPYSLLVMKSSEDSIRLKDGKGSVLDIAPTLAAFAGGEMMGVQGKSLLS